MKLLAWRWIDKAAWGPGPWQNEPDKMQYPDPGTDLPCLVLRNRLGALCGYVGVASGHPAFMRDYDEVEVQVHGGLTFSGFCQEDHEHGICHVVEPGEPDRVWWLGFDCGHFMDRMPAMEQEGAPFNHYPGAVYRTLEYVMSENAELADQLVRMRKRKRFRKERRALP